MFSGMRSTDVVSPAAYFAQASNDIMRASLDTGSDITDVARANDNAAAKLSKQQLLNDTAKTLVDNKIAFNKKVGKIGDRIGGQIDKINNSTKRMAGFTSLLGTLGTFGVMNQQNIIRKEERAADQIARKAESDALKNIMQQTTDNPVLKRIEEMMKDNSNKIDEYRKQLDSMPNISNPTNSLPSSNQQAMIPGSKQVSLTPNTLSKEEVKQYALDAGFTPDQAFMVTGISGGESRRDPTNSTKRSGLFARTGEDSVGLMQINWGYHKGRGWLQNLGITSREQLFDPATNMKAAKFLFDQKGTFDDWTVYNTGEYKDWL